MVLCLLGRRVMTSLPLLEFWLHVLLLVVLKTPLKKMNKQCHFTVGKYNMNGLLFTLERTDFIARRVNHLCLGCLLSESLKIFVSQAFKD